MKKTVAVSALFIFASTFASAAPVTPTKTPPKPAPVPTGNSKAGDLQTLQNDKAIYLKSWNKAVPDLNNINRAKAKLETDLHNGANKKAINDDQRSLAQDKKTATSDAAALKKAANDLQKAQAQVTRDGPSYVPGPAKKSNF